MADQSMLSGKRKEQFVSVEKAKDVTKTVQRLFFFFWKDRSLLIGMIFIVALGAACGILAPSWQSQAIDALSNPSKEVLTGAVIVMMTFYRGYCLCQLVQGRMSAVLSQRVVYQLRQSLFDKVIDMPVRYLDTHAHGDVMSRMTNDIEALSTTISDSLPSMISGVLTITGTMAAMVYFCWELALLSMLTILLTVFVSKLLGRKVRSYSRNQQALLGKLNDTAEEMIDSYETVMAFNRQKTTVLDFNETSDHLTKTAIWAESISGVMGPIMNCIGNIGFVIIAVFGGYFASIHLISIGVVSAFVVYARQFSRPINELAQIYGQMQTAVAAAERIFQILDEQSENREGKKIKCADHQTLTFRNVSFAYASDQWVLRHFDLTIPYGQKLALVGATGSGKTTLTNLLLRFYDINEGEIRIGNQNIQDLSCASLRRRMTIVLQDTCLFSDTLRNNLLYANAKEDPQKIEQALEWSGCREWIAQLPQGLDTVISGDKDALSQGQKQLLAIARAFMADPDILIFDEATSKIDTRTEADVQMAMQRIMENRTCIIIAHRLSTIRNADRILVLDQGRIVEDGTHDQLMAAHGRYYDLYQTQFAGFQT